MQIFILAEGLKIEFFRHYQVEKAVWCESCEQLDITHPSACMTWRFVIQGCPTLKSCSYYQNKPILHPNLVIHYLRGSLPFLLAMDNYINVFTRQLRTWLKQLDSCYL